MNKNKKQPKCVLLLFIWEKLRFFFYFCKPNSLSCYLYHIVIFARKRDLNTAVKISQENDVCDRCKGKACTREPMVPTSIKSTEKWPNGQIIEIFIIVKYIFAVSTQLTPLFCVCSFIWYFWYLIGRLLLRWMFLILFDVSFYPLE